MANHRELIKTEKKRHKDNLRLIQLIPKGVDVDFILYRTVHINVESFNDYLDIVDQFGPTQRESYYWGYNDRLVIQHYGIAYGGFAYYINFHVREALIALDKVSEGTCHMIVEEKVKNTKTIACMNGSSA